MVECSIASYSFHIPLLSHHSTMMTWFLITGDVYLKGAALVFDVTNMVGFLLLSNCVCCTRNDNHYT